jgi:hypothetical protein
VKNKSGFLARANFLKEEWFMRVVERVPYVPAERKLDQAINEKIKVLREFYIVDDHNEEAIRQKLIKAVKAEPNKNFDIILDRVAHTMIMNRLND